MSNGILNLYLIQHRSIVQFDKKGVADGAFRRFVIIDAEVLLFHAVDFGAKGIDTRIGSGSVRATGRNPKS